MTRKARDLAELSEGAVHCRAFGHQWHDHSADPVGRAKGWTVTLICASCGTRKLFQLSRRGELSAPRYQYPEGYLATFFIGNEERAAMRLEALGLPAGLPAAPKLRVVADPA